MFVDVLLEKNVRGRQTACRQMLIRCERESFGQLKMICDCFCFCSAVQQRVRYGEL